MSTAPLPPDSWPGAGGRRSVAPEVAPWPGASRAKKTTPGESWPGAVPAGSGPAPSRGSATASNDATRDALRARIPANSVDPAARNLWRLTGLLAGVPPLLAVVGWIVLDPGHRVAQVAALALVALAVLVGIAVVPARRFTQHRWEVTPDAVLAQTGVFAPHRRVVPLREVRSVSASSGGLEQVFGLSGVVLHTERGRVRIGGLAAATAKRVAKDVKASLPPR